MHLWGAAADGGVAEGGEELECHRRWLALPLGGRLLLAARPSVINETGDDNRIERIELPAFGSAELLDIRGVASVGFLGEIRRRRVPLDLIHVERQPADLDIMAGGDAQGGAAVTGVNHTRWHACAR